MKSHISIIRGNDRYLKVNLHLTHIPDSKINLKLNYVFSINYLDGSKTTPVKIKINTKKNKIRPRINTIFSLD